MSRRDMLFLDFGIPKTKKEYTRSKTTTKIISLISGVPEDKINDDYSSVPIDYVEQDIGEGMYWGGVFGSLIGFGIGVILVYYNQMTMEWLFFSYIIVVAISIGMALLKLRHVWQSKYVWKTANSKGETVH